MFVEFHDLTRLPLDALTDPELAAAARGNSDLRRWPAEAQKAVRRSVEGAMTRGAVGSDWEGRATFVSGVSHDDNGRYAWFRTTVPA